MSGNATATATASSGSGVSFFTLLGLVFIVLKLTHVISWSWWLVLLPIYGSVALAIGFLVLFAIGAILLSKSKKW